jgi:hypothetical protein
MCSPLGAGATVGPVSWVLFGGMAAALALLAGRGFVRRRSQNAAADAAGLIPVRDLTHLPSALQRSALWTLADGGFERRVVHGVVSCGREDTDVTAFDLETLRDRRGEWAYLPVEPPFRIAGVVSVVVCEVDREFPHYVLKRAGLGDALIDDDLLERSGNIAKLTRDSLGMSRVYPAELPTPIAPEQLGVEMPEQWRAYGPSSGPIADLLANGLGTALKRAGRRDLVVELIGGLVICYPAAREAEGADAFADLTELALVVVDGVLAGSPRLSPRGVESQQA